MTQSINNQSIKVSQGMPMKELHKHVCSDECCEDQGCPNHYATNEGNTETAHQLLGDTPEALIDDYLQSPIKSAVDVVEAIRELMIAAPAIASQDEPNFVSMLTSLAGVINSYDRSVTANAIAVDHLTQEKASDKDLQSVAHNYDMTMNQTVAFMDMCEQVNGQMKGTGIIAVPFWFYDQYVEMQKKEAALIHQTDNLLETLAVVKDKVASGKSTIADLGLDMPVRKNIITGISTPYIAGVTGARLGDEHLDPEHIYVPNVKGRR